MMSQVKEIPAAWIPAGACGGCAVSMLNTVAPFVKDRWEVTKIVQTKYFKRIINY
jgi:Ni,Fe-hydrogenase I small subunit